MLLLAVFALLASCTSETGEHKNPDEAKTDQLDRVGFGKVGAWVKKVPIPKPDFENFTDGAEILLLDRQDYYGKGKWQSYISIAAYVHGPAGLSPAGNINAQWNPARQSLTVHRVSILRGKQKIDALANGKEFSILQREQNLEASFIDGIKTAVFQIEGLMVGDIVDFAYSLDTKAPAITKTTSELFFRLGQERAQKLRIRQVWPEHINMKWQVSSDLPEPDLIKTKLGHELILNLDGFKLEEPKTSAPLRYYIKGALAVSNIEDWSQISREYMPFFAKAAKIKYGSDLYMEAEKIAKNSYLADDTKAAMALRLVQEQIRYLFVGLGSGDYIPASAEETWANKHGDCKDKTALLLALLDHLEIEAEPVLVSTVFGDGLNDRLPVLGVFDHIIVRAKIFDKEVWLDGTLTEDRSIDRIEPPAYKWGLPLREEGSPLIKIQQTAPEYNSFFAKLEIDASKGAHGELAVTGTYKVRGRMAREINAAAASMDSEQKAKWYKTFWSSAGDIDVQSNTSTIDEANGDFKLDMSGTIKLRSKKRLTKDYFKIPFFSYYPEATFLYSLDGEEEREIPWALPEPYRAKFETIIMLPETRTRSAYDHAPFSWDKYGLELKRDVFGGYINLHLTRTIAVKEPEISNTHAREFIKALDESSDNWQSYFVLYKSADQITDMKNKKLETVSEYIDRGLFHLNRRNYQQAINDFSAAAQIDPDNPYPFANRGLAHARIQNFYSANSDFDKALSLDENNKVALRGKGYVAGQKGDHEAAVMYLEQSLNEDPNSYFARSHLIYSLVKLGSINEALVQTDKFIEHYPDNRFVLELRDSLKQNAELTEGFLNYIKGRRKLNTLGNVPSFEIKTEQVDP